MMWQDPIVEEIREIRRNIEGECDNNFDKLFAQAIEAQKKLTNRLVSKGDKMQSKSESRPASECEVN